VLGAIVAFIIDKRFWHAAIFAGVGAVLSFVGLIHARRYSSRGGADRG
jgi:AGZA family xanthine/uracil permease-like MFS transporter